MTFIRDLISDLIAKRLWPIAVLLVGALIAVPVVLSKPAPKDEQAVAQAESTAKQAQKDTAAAQPVVSLASAETTSKAHVRGLRAKDPFRRAKAKKSDAAAPAAGGDGSAGDTGGTGGSGGSEPPATTPEPPKVYISYDVDLRFGEAGAQKTRHNIPRLTALPNSSDPVVVYMGVLSGGKTAVFLVSAEATPQGDATCKPKKSECTYVYMHEGDTEFFDVGAGTAGLVQYELKLLSIDSHKTTSKAKAAKFYARESHAGREILRAEISSLGYLHFSPRTGTLAVTDDVASRDADGSDG